jgi:hypothetical protein
MFANATRFSNCLNLHRTIRRVLAAGMLALFALAITPKLAIHALVVHHHDVHLNQDLCTIDQLNAASFHCPTDNLVVALPYLTVSVAVLPGVHPVFAAQRASSLVAHLSGSHPLYGLRGPPGAV